LFSLIGDQLDAKANALIADVDPRSGHQVLHITLSSGLSAEAASSIPFEGFHG